MKASHLLVAWFIAAGVARAQSADNFWLISSTLDGGGARAAGGGFVLEATIGQPDAGPAAAGGDFNFDGGFWPFDLPTAPPPPALLLHIAITSGGRVEVTAQATPGATATVQANTDIANPNGWVNLGVVVAGADGLMQFIDTDMVLYSHRFYRFAVP